MATQHEGGERASILRPLMSPWRELPDGAAPSRRPEPKGIWRSIGAFLFDYNRY